MTDVQNTLVAPEYKVCSRCAKETLISEFRNGYCKICSKEYRRYYYSINRDKILSKVSRYRIDNLESCKRRSIEWQKNNPDKLKENQRKYRKSHLEQRRAYNNEWRKNNPEKAAIHVHNRRSRKMGNGNSSYTKEDIKQFLILQKQKCAICNVSIKSGYHIDHIVPLSKGGNNTRYNIQLLCPLCNLSKNAFDPIEFMQSRGMLL